jgi:peroxiredoxin-like protein
VRWGSDRRGKICSSGKPDIEISSPPEFKGEAGFWTPEDMFIASVNTCTLMTFVAYAQHKGLEFVTYESEAEGLLENVEGKYRFTEIVLHPHLSVKSAEDVERAQKMMEDAHKGCLVSNSITTRVKVFPDIRIIAAGE